MSFKSSILSQNSLTYFSNSITLRSTPFIFIALTVSAYIYNWCAKIEVSPYSMNLILICNHKCLHNHGLYEYRYEYKVVFTLDKTNTLVLIYTLAQGPGFKSQLRKINNLFGSISHGLSLISGDSLGYPALLNGYP